MKKFIPYTIPLRVATLPKQVQDAFFCLWNYGIDREALLDLLFPKRRGPKVDLIKKIQKRASKRPVGRPAKYTGDFHARLLADLNAGKKELTEKRGGSVSDKDAIDELLLKMKPQGVSKTRWLNDNRKTYQNQVAIARAASRKISAISGRN